VTDFRIDIPPPALDDLRTRLDRIRWADDVTGDDADWSWGTPPVVLRALVDQWRDGYDWRATEERWNALRQELVVVDGAPLHVVRAGTPGATPLLLVHGWPDGFLRFEKALPLLADRFDIVIPSVPGYGFSPAVTTPGTGPVRVADLFAGLMAAYGFERFGVHGADIGSTIAEVIAQRHPAHVVGVHLGDVPAWHRYTVDPAAVSDTVRGYLDGMNAWFAAEGAYAALQRTKPQTLGWALVDSPVGLLAWIAEKLQAWTDGGIAAYDAAEILDDVSLYWFTGTAASAARYYRESAVTPPDATLRAAVPAGFTVFPRDISPAPREYAELFFDVARFTVAERGGHFGPWEQPQVWADDVRAFFDDVQG